MDTIEVGQIWVGNVDGTRFEITAIDPPFLPGRRPYWKWRTEDGRTGSAASTLITHACTLAEKEN